MSVAGGLPLAVERAVAHRCEAFQIFSKNANQWRGRELTLSEARRFRSKVKAAGLRPVFSHASYLINLAAAQPQLREQSLAAMADEMDRADALGLLGVVLHPGCFTAGSEAAGLDLIADAVLDGLTEGQVRGGKDIGASERPPVEAAVRERPPSGPVESPIDGPTGANY